MTSRENDPLKEMILLFHLTRMVMSCVKNIYHFLFLVQKKKLVVNVGEK